MDNLKLLEKEITADRYALLPEGVGLTAVTVERRINDIEKEYNASVFVQVMELVHGVIKPTEVIRIPKDFDLHLHIAKDIVNNPKKLLMDDFLPDFLYWYSEPNKTTSEWVEECGTSCCLAGNAVIATQPVKSLTNQETEYTGALGALLIPEFAHLFYHVDDEEAVIEFLQNYITLKEQSNA